MTAIMIQGTNSSAGKSLICTGLSRVFKEDGYKVYPFKSQNMSNNYYILEDGRKISTAQALQAKAALLNPEVDMNPILLMPKTDMGSMVVIMGKEYKHMEAKEYFDFKPSLKPMIKELIHKLQVENDIVVIEGAGSPAEINLLDNDIVNMGMAEMANSPVLLVADIDRGGVFASIYGTVMLLDKKFRDRIKGIIINKFRGDKELLIPGIMSIEELVNIPVLGIIPFMKFELEDEDTIIDYEKKCNTQVQADKEIEEELSKLANHLREHMDINKIYEIMSDSNV